MKMIETVGDLKKALAHIPDHYEVWARDLDCYAHEIAGAGCGERTETIKLANGEILKDKIPYCVIDLDHKD
jgi:hypothetical protein